MGPSICSQNTHTHRIKKKANGKRFFFFFFYLVAAAAAVDGGGFRFCGGGRRRRENSGLPFCERCSHHITFGSGLIDDPSPSLVLLLLDDMTTGCLSRTERTCTAVFNEVARLVFLFDFLFFFFFFQGKRGADHWPPSISSLNPCPRPIRQRQ